MANDEPIDEQRFVDYIKHKIPTVAQQWFPESYLKQRLTLGLRRDIVLMFDLSSAIAFHNYCPVESAAVKDYLNKLITLPDKNQLIASIRFDRLDTAFPFVEIDQLTFDAIDYDPTQLLHSINPVFAVFKPEYVRFFSAQDSQTLMCDTRFVVGLLDDILQHPPEQAERVRVERVHNLRQYERYSRAYDAFHVQMPHLKEAVPKETRESMLSYIDSGGVFDAYVDGDWLGTVIVDPYDESLWRGFMVADEIISPEFKGQGLGAAMQYQALKMLDYDDYNVIVGTIHPQNMPSLKTAKRLRRVDIGGYYRLPLQ